MPARRADRRRREVRFATGRRALHRRSTGRSPVDTARGQDRTVRQIAGRIDDGRRHDVDTGSMGRRSGRVGRWRRGLPSVGPRLWFAADASLVPSDALGSLVGAWSPFAKHMINGVYQTVRSIDAAARERESLVALGTLAAGLAHEINNPASASMRAVEALRRASEYMMASLVGARRAGHRRCSVPADRPDEDGTPATPGVQRGSDRTGRSRGVDRLVARGPRRRHSLAGCSAAGHLRRRQRLVGRTRGHRRCRSVVACGQLDHERGRDDVAARRSHRGNGADLASGRGREDLFSDGSGGTPSRST